MEIGLVKKNRWEKLASIFKLRLFEEFTLDIDRKNKFYFSLHGLAKVGSDGNPQLVDEELKMMLDGEAEITLPKFAPRNCDNYWYWDDFSTLRSRYWDNSFTDKQRLMHVGNCFRTADDARESLKELRESMKDCYENLMQDTFYKKKE